MIASKKISAHDHETIKKIYKSGVTLTQIGRLFDLHRSTVKYHVDDEFRHKKSLDAKDYWSNYGKDEKFTEKHRPRSAEVAKNKRRGRDV